MEDNYDDRRSIVDSRKSAYSTRIGSYQSSAEKYDSSPSLSEGPFKAFSIFGDSACGEPLKAQQLVIDFTPIDEIDTEYVQEKCNAFWEYINSQPDLQGLMTHPDLNLDMNVSDTSDTAPAPSPVKKRDKIVPPKMDEQTALSVLEITGEKGMINRAFVPKVQRSQCTLGSREYIENEPTKTGVATRNVCVCPTCKPCRKLICGAASSTLGSSHEVKDLSHKMNEWGNLNPKSMEPPGHPPALSHSVMQRKRPTTVRNDSLNYMKSLEDDPTRHCLVELKLPTLF